MKCPTAALTKEAKEGDKINREFCENLVHDLRLWWLTSTFPASKANSLFWRLKLKFIVCRGSYSISINKFFFSYFDGWLVTNSRENASFRKQITRKSPLNCFQNQPSMIHDQQSHTRLIRTHTQCIL